MLPRADEIETYCGAQVYQNWSTSPPCTSFIETGDREECEGSFLVYLGEQDTTYTKVVYLPRPEALFELDNCRADAWCKQRPIFRFYGQEPLDGYQIETVYVQIGSRQVTCGRADCFFNLPETDSRGIWVDYWAVSSYGDESPHQTIHLRNLSRKLNGKQEYFVEVLSAMQVEAPASLVWDAFPTAAHPDALLYNQVENVGQLNSANHLYYLAGRLIFTGQVDAADCVMGGLLDNGMANTCGEEKAYATTLEWQNQYNLQIYQAARHWDVPARVLKGILAQESQFWPDPQIEDEYGLGSLSENGVDMLLTIDESGFLAYCLSNFDAETCALGYTNLSDVQRAYLRGMALRAVNTDGEIDLLARTLRASSIQVGELVRDLTQGPAGEASAYEDLWEFSIANYHAGPGCVERGLKTLADEQKGLTFEDYCAVANDCPMACTYVERVKALAR
jgi:hypothetical protein